MARIRCEQNEAVDLLPSTLVGRSLNCTVRIDEPSISREHARIFWDGLSWTLKDLGSRNYTFVDGKRLEPGGFSVLRRGASVVFGGCARTWSLVDDSAPRACAIRLDTQEVIVAKGSELALHADGATTAVVRRASDHWLFVHEKTAREVADGDIVTVRGIQFRLALPVSSLPTRGNAETGALLQDAALNFVVSADEESIAIFVATPSGAQALRPRAHNSAILCLARARMADARDDVTDAECGWLYVDDLCSQLKVDLSKLNIDLHRFRKQIRGAGIVDADGIVERRLDTRQLRLGVARLSVLHRRH